MVHAFDDNQILTDGLQGKWYTLLPHPYYMSHLDNPQVAEQDLNIFYQLDSSDKYFDLHCLCKCH